LNYRKREKTNPKGGKSDNVIGCCYLAAAAAGGLRRKKKKTKDVTNWKEKEEAI